MATLPYGRQKILEFGGLMLMNPDPVLYMLDEPFAGLAQGEITRYLTLMRQMREAGKTFLIVEHNVRLIMTICDTIVVLDHGEKIAVGPPAESSGTPGWWRRISAMPALLEIDRLTSGYGAVPALHDVSLTVEALETVCVLGANGAGKTTLVNTIAGVLKPSGGRITFQGEDVTHLKPEQLAARGLALVRQGRSVFPHMTVRENLDMGAYLVRDRAAAQERREAAFEMFPFLQQRAGQMAGSMSGGEQKMLEIARSLMFPVKLLILDEPSLGLAPMVVDTMFDASGGSTASG